MVSLDQTLYTFVMNVRYYQLINKIFDSLKIRDALSALNLGDVSPFVRPFVTVARDPGSGGAPIAEKVAQLLGYEYVHEQIVDQISQSTKKRRTIIKAVDEKSRSTIEDIVHSVLNKEYIDDTTYVSELVKVILAYALRGHVVLLGRGANFICPAAKGLHVRITAPYSVRVQRAMEYEGFNRVKAKQVIAKVEAERDDFVRQYFKKDPTEANYYDLTINTAHYTVDAAADVIVDAFYKKFSRMARYTAVLSK